MRAPLAGLPLKREFALPLASALGFGVGAALAGASGDLLLPGFGVMGGLGGYALAIVRKDPPARWALAGMLGFFVGFAFPFFFVLSVYEPPLAMVWVGAVGGGLGGLALGLAWRSQKAARRLGAAGAGGFAAGLLLLEAAKLAGVPEILPPSARLAYGAVLLGAAGAIGGAVLGRAAHRLEREERGGAAA